MPNLTSTLKYDNSTIPTFNSPVPFWGTIMIAAAGCLLLLIAFICCIFCLCRCTHRSKRKAIKIAMDNNLSNFESRNRLISENLNSDYGVLSYTFDYDLRKSNLTIGVKEIKDLPGGLFSKPLNPFVKVRLLPDLLTQQTSVARFSRNPTYNESFNFNMQMKKQAESVVMFMVYDHQIFRRHVKLSQCSIPLTSVMLDQVVEASAALEAPVLSEEDTDTGEVCISLRYMPAQETLNVIVIEAKNLQTQEKSYKDPYVKVYMLVDKKVVKKKKTKTRAVCDINPYFNESFNFPIKPFKLQTTELIVRVAFRKRMAIMSKNIGECYISSTRIGTGLKHWLEITGKPGYPLAMWHSLLPCER